MPGGTTRNASGKTPGEQAGLGPACSESRGGYVELGIGGEAHRANPAGDAVGDSGVGRLGADGDADGAPVLHRGADVDVHARRRPARTDVRAVVENRAEL